MAHDIEDNRFISTQNEWHDQGAQAVIGLSVEQAIAQVHPELLCHVPMQGFTEGHTYPAPDCFGVYRVGPNGAKFLATVGDKHTITQPIDLIGDYQHLLDTGLVELQTAGLLQDGKKIFVTAKVKDSAREIVRNDVVDQYFTIATGLCGNMNHRMFSAAQRTVCANTLRVSLKQGENNGSMVAARNTRSIHEKRANWLEVVKRSLVDWDDTVRAYKAIAKKEIKDDRTIQAYVDQVFEVDRTKEVHAKTENKVRYVCDLFDNGRGTELVEANYWRAYNAVTEYLTHNHGHNADSRLDSLMFGESSKVSQRALSLAMSA